jgi:hypothetical protein
LEDDEERKEGDEPGLPVDLRRLEQTKDVLWE